MGAKAALVLMAMLSLGLYTAREWDGTLGTSDERVIHLNFWNGFTGPDGRTMLEIIRQFNESHPGIEVTMQRMEWAIYYNKLMVAGIDDRAPEVFVIHASTLPRFARAGFIAGIDELFEGSPPRLPLDDFEAELMRQLRYDGQTIGVPMDIHPQGLYLNAALLREAGLVDTKGQARPPVTYDEFMAAVHAMHDDPDGDGRADQWGFSWSMWRHNFQSLMPQFGGRYFNDDGTSALDCPENVAALAFMVSLREGELLVPPPENNLGWVGFRQKKVAMVFDGVYMLGDLKRLEGLEYVAAPMPQIGPNPGTHGDAHVMCLQEDLDDDTRAAALEFMAFVSDHGLNWADAGQVPARRSARESEAFKSMQVQSAFAEQLPYVLFPPRSPAVFELQQQLDFAVEKALRGRATPEEALREARENFETFVRNAGLPMLADSEAPS